MAELQIKKGSLATSNQLALFVRCTLLACAILFLPGCGIGVLIVGGVVAGVLLSGDGKSSSPAGASSSPFLSPPPDRGALRERGNASLVPVCYKGGGADGSRVVVEYALQSEDFDVWRRAARAMLPNAGPACSGANTFWWDAERDLGLSSNSAQRVRVRIRSREDFENASTSPPFIVGNTPPVIELVQTEDNEGLIVISFRAQDAEGDSLYHVALFYRVPPRVAGDDSLEAKMVFTQDLPSEVIAPENGFLHSRVWNSEDATQSHNVTGLRVRFEGHDPFGVVATATLLLDLKNNSPAEARFLAEPEDLDSSFAVPIPFKLLDANSDTADIVVQYALGDEPFPPLPADPWLDSSSRARLLESPDDAPERSRLHIATPSGRAGSGPRGLRTSRDGVEHTFVWDTTRDLPTAAPTSVRLRVTPFDEDQGIAAETPGEFVVNNDLFPVDLKMAEGQGSVKGVAMGDVDGDGRPDVALSLFQAPSRPDLDNCDKDQGRVDVYLRSPDGSLSAEAFHLVPGVGEPASPCAERHRGPIDLLLTDIDADGRSDLVVLGSNCAEDNCKGIPGDVSIFFGNGLSQALPGRPDVLLQAGADVRSVGIGDFDGDKRLDIAVSNHENIAGPPVIPRGVGVFRQLESRRFSAMSIYSDCEDEKCEPGLLVCGDFNGDGRDDIAVRQDEIVKNRVLILSWSTVTSELMLWATVQLNGRDGDFANFTPVSLDSRDLDLNGFADLIVGSRRTSAVFVLMNHGDGSFETASKTCLSASPEKIGLVDLTADGRFEVVALEPDRVGNTVEIAEMKAGGCCPDPCAFKQIALTLPPAGGTGPSLFSTQDLNQDGRPDLLFGSTDSAHLFPAVGEGGFISGRERVLRFEPSALLKDLLLGDFNGDGLADIAAGAAVEETRDNHYEVLMYFQNRRGKFAEKPNRVLESRPGPNCAFQNRLFLAHTDTDGDGAADVIAVSRDGGADIFWRGEAGFTEEPTGSVQACDDAPLQGGPVVLGHFGGDLEVDLLRLDPYGDGTSLAGRILFDSLALASDSDGHPTLVHSEKPAFLTEPLPLAMASADFDRDGLDDIVLLHASSSRITLLRQDPNKPWPSRLVVASQVPAGARTGTLFATHLDKDDFLDILLAPESGERVIGFKQVSSGASSAIQFVEAFELRAGGRPVGPAVADLNGDGGPDVAVGAAGESSVRLFFQRADGSHNALSSWAIDVGKPLSPASRLAALDVTGDGSPDLIVLDPAAHEIRILEAR